MLLLQRGDLLHLDAGAQLDLVAGDGRPARAAGDRGVDLELLQDRADRIGHLIVGGAALLRRIAGHQQAQRRQRVRALDDPVEGQGVLPGSGFGVALAAARHRGLRHRRAVIRGDRAGARRPRLGFVVAVRRGFVVVTVGKVFGDTAFHARFVVVLIAVAVVEHPGAEHGAQRVRQFADRGASQQK